MYGQVTVFINRILFFFFLNNKPAHVSLPLLSYRVTTVVIKLSDSFMSS